MLARRRKADAGRRRRLCVAVASPLLKRQMNGSWALLKAWQRTELPARAPPMPPKAVFALAEWLLRQGRTGMSLGVGLAAHETVELLDLGFAELSWAESFRSAIVSLGVTKGGARRGAAESVSVELAWLSRRCGRGRRRNLSPSSSTRPSTGSGNYSRRGLLHVAARTGASPLILFGAAARRGSGAAPGPFRA